MSLTGALLERPALPFVVRDVPLGDGRRLRVAQYGEGRPIVLIHGALVDGRDWLTGSAAALRDMGRLLVVDRPGHGGSTRPRFEADPHAQAAQLRAGLRQIGVDRPVLVGHSLGAAVSLAFAADFPEEVAGLALVAPIAFPEVRPIEHGYLAPRAAPVAGPMLSALGRSTTDPAFWVTVRKLMFSPQEPTAAWLAAFPASEVTRPEKLVAEGEDAAAMFPGSPGSVIAYDRITAPTVVLTGDRDKVADPNRHARPLSRRLAQAELREFEGVGHMLHHVRAEAVAGAVRDLLSRP
ncbi:MAG TPA: alpha/beta hydrolase [Caulobacteraceae bacterium]|jgi:pimeloyl-ACP methyl ester carboxylesterase